VYATALDFARFGEMYRNDGAAADGTRVVPAVGATTRARSRRTTTTVASTTAPTGGCGPISRAAFGCHGYEGQFTLVVPDRELVVVHLGKTPADLSPVLVAHLRSLVSAATA